MTACATCSSESPEPVVGFEDISRGTLPAALWLGVYEHSFATPVAPQLRKARHGALKAD